MGGRGTYAIGNNVKYQYETVDLIEGVKVLKGTIGSGKHGLPETAHHSEAYIKLDHNGNFSEIRFYDKAHCLYLEIAYHTEESLTGNRHTKILHYHTYDSNFSMSNDATFYRSDAKLLSKEMKDKYKKYFRGIKV